MSESSISGTELVEIVDDAEKAKERWDDPSRVGPEEPKVTVSADLFAHLLAHAGREDWIIYSPTWMRAREVLQSMDTGGET